MLEKYDYRSPAQVRRDLLGAGRGGVEANTVKPLSKNPGAVQAAKKSLVGKRPGLEVRRENDEHVERHIKLSTRRQGQEIDPRLQRHESTD